jgi:hypothetical protein
MDAVQAEKPDACQLKGHVGTFAPVKPTLAHHLPSAHEQIPTTLHAVIPPSNRSQPSLKFPRDSRYPAYEPYSIKASL